MKKLATILRPNRSWLQFRLRTIFVITAAVALVVGWPHLRRQYAFWRLQDYVDVDLQKLPHVEARQVHAWLDRVISPHAVLADEPYPCGSTVEYWLVHGSSYAMPERQIHVVQMKTDLSWAGSSECAIHVFDRSGRWLRAFKFNTGHSGSAYPVAVKFDESCPGLLLLAVTTDGLRGNRRQYYRISEKYIELMRSEAIDGTLRMWEENTFDVSEKPPDWADWEQLLESSDAITQLRGVAALSSWENEKLRQVSESTALRLKELSRSSDPWVREVCEHVLKRLRLRVED